MNDHSYGVINRFNHYEKDDETVDHSMGSHYMTPPEQRMSHLMMAARLVL